MSIATLSVLCTALITSAPTETESPQFRGTSGSGWSASLTHPESWSETDSIAWSVEVPGAGWSAPVITQGLVFVTTAVSATAPKPMGFQEGVSAPQTRGAAGTKPTEPVTFQVLCFGLEDGTLRWTRTLDERVPEHATHPSNTYATETPATDGESLYVFFGAIGLVCCLDFEGEELWRRDIGTYPMTADFGTGSSLTLHEGLLFVLSDNSASSFLLALDSESGDEMWRAERAAGSGWATPTLWTHEGGTELVACGAGAVTSYDPETGDQIWRVEDIQGSFSASPACDAERVYFGNSGPGTQGPLMAIEAGAADALAIERELPAGVAWYARGEGPGFASPVVAGDHLYVIASGGVLRCFDATTGERLYRERLPDAATIAASPWVAGDRLFILNEAGTTFVVKTGESYELLQKNELDDLFWSTPAVANDALLLRGASRLYCVRAAD